MPFIAMCRKMSAVLLLKGARLVRNYIFSCYGISSPVERESTPFDGFFPKRCYSFRRTSRK